MRWSLGDGTRAEAVEQGARLAAAVGVPPAVGRILWARGHKDAQAVQRFLEPKLDQLPDPFGLKGIDAAVARLHRALAQQENICVYGDYDVDGVDPAALLRSVLRQLGGHGGLFVPPRALAG